MLNRFYPSFVLSLFSISISFAWADQTQTRTSAFTYYSADGSGASFGKLQYEEVEPNSANLCVHSEYTYDSHGNQLDTKIKPCAGGTSFNQREATIAYDSNAQFPASKTTYVPSSPVSSQTENYTKTDPRFSVVLAATGADGLSTSTQLDALGRVVEKAATDNSYTIATAYTCLSQTEQGYDSSDDSSLLPDARGGDGACAGGTYTHPTSNIVVKAADYVETIKYGANGAPQGGVTRVYHDTMGREIATVTTGIDLTSSVYYLRTLKAYDNHGRQAYTSVVHRIDDNGNLLDGASSLRWNVSTFDSYGRPLRTYTPDDVGINTSDTTDSTENSTPISTLTGTARVMGVNLSVDGQTKNYQVVVDSGQNSQTFQQLSLAESNALGQLLRKTDAINSGNGNQIAFSYDAEGNLSGTLTHDAAGNTITSSFQYDIKGRKTQQTDPDLGTWVYTYDALGELTQQTDNNPDSSSNWQKMTYDELGRVITRQVSGTTGFTATYSYDCNRAGGIGGDGYSYSGVGVLCEESTTQGYDKKYAYGRYGHFVHAQTNLGTGSGGRTYDNWQSYDNDNSRPDIITYPTGVQIQSAYSGKGFITSVNRVDSGLNQALWTATGIDQWGNIKQWQLGNGLITTRYLDASGRIICKKTGTTASTDCTSSGTAASIQDVAYAYNVNGDMGIRQDKVENLQENFSYDALHRLIEWTRISNYQNANGSNTYDVGYNYDGIGNLIYRSDRGCFKYGTGNAMPHALMTFYNSDCSGTASASIVTSMVYDSNGSLKTITQNGSTVEREHSWNSFHQPDWIQWDTGGVKKVQWLYDADLNRVQETKLSNGNVQSTIYKLNPGDNPFFEQVVNTVQSTTQNRYFISTPVGIIGTLTTQGDIGSVNLSQAKMEYWHVDHLNSISALTDDNKNVLERFQYDPFGERLDSYGRAATTSQYTDRGFTQHEHIDELNLVHMNGRIFDPILGRFLQADPNIPHIGILQSYNRYSYCMNNPVMCKDPTGFIDGWVSPSLIGFGYSRYVAPALVSVSPQRINGNNVQAATPSFTNVSADSTYNNTPSYNNTRYAYDYSNLQDDPISGYRGPRQYVPGRGLVVPSLQDDPFNGYNGPRTYIAGQGLVVPTLGSTGYAPGKGWIMPMLQSSIDQLHHSVQNSYASVGSTDNAKDVIPQRDSRSYIGIVAVPYVINGVVGGISGGVAAINSGNKNPKAIAEAIVAGAAFGTGSTFAFGVIGGTEYAWSTAAANVTSAAGSNYFGQLITNQPGQAVDFNQVYLQGALGVSTAAVGVIAAEEVVAEFGVETANVVAASVGSTFNTASNLILPSQAGGLDLFSSCGVSTNSSSGDGSNNQWGIDLDSSWDD